MLRSVAVLLCCLLIVPVAISGPGEQVRKPAPNGTYWNNYPYGDHVKSIWGVRVKSTDGDQLAPSWLSIDLQSDTDIKTGRTEGQSYQESDVLLNGVRFDPEGVVNPEVRTSEIARWNSFVGPIRAEKRKDGTINLIPLDGAELKSCLDWCETQPWLKSQIELVPPEFRKYHQPFWQTFSPRITTLEDCRKLWRRERAGEIKWDFDAKKYVDVPVAKRVPFKPDGDPLPAEVIPPKNGPHIVPFKPVPAPKYPHRVIPFGGARNWD
jgi:hypothetical protein